MRIAKIISIITNAVFIFEWFGFLITTFRIQSLYKGDKPIYEALLVVILALLVVSIIVVINLCFLYRLVRKEQSNKELKNPILWSIAMALISIVLYIILWSFIGIIPYP
jgi:uncharacterized protein with PQ loop repeat